MTKQGHGQSEKVYTPEQLEKGRRFMVRLRQAAILARERIREEEIQKRLAALPPATAFTINLLALGDAIVDAPTETGRER